MGRKFSTKTSFGMHLLPSLLARLRRKHQWYSFPPETARGKVGWWISVAYCGYCIWYSLVWCFWGLFPFYHGKNHGKFCKQYVWDLLTKASWAMLSICYPFHTRVTSYIPPKKTRNTNEVIKEPGMVFPFPIPWWESKAIPPGCHLPR